MTGLDAATGALLTGNDHLRQSVADILSTPIGSRVGRRDYGSLLPDLIDQPMNGTGVMRLMAATALALLRWEPRLRLTSVSIRRTAAGAYVADLVGRRLDLVASGDTRLTVPLPSA